MAVKTTIWLFALASGTSGGILAPLLIMGCSLGAIESLWLPGNVDSGTWALIGMSAIMAGMMRSPFTAIVFSLELTQDVTVLPALLIASIASYAFTVAWMKRSILTEKVARRGYDIFREYSIDPLERFMVKDVLLTNMAENLDLPTQNIPSIYADETCRCAADRMAANDVTQLKVLNRKDKKVLGIVSLQALLKARLMSFKEETYRETMFPFKRKVPGKN